MRFILIQRMGKLWKEFIPLSMSDVMMALGDPMVNATMAQLPKLQTNLSALGVIKALIVFFESPIIMILHASNRLSDHEDARVALKKFVIIASTVLTSFLVILAFPQIFFPLMSLVGLTDEISKHAHAIFLCLLWWPASIAFRRYYQGILIIHKQLNVIAKAGLLRIAVLAFCLSLGFYFHIKSTYLAGCSLMFAILAETLAVYWVARRFINSKCSRKYINKDTNYPKTIREIWKFYWPLANSMIVVWAGRALLVVCLARSVDSTLALAVWPATWALVVVFSNSTRMIQQVIIRNQNSFHPGECVLFAISVGFLLTIFLFLLGLSSIGQYFLTYFVGTNQTLLENVRVILCICACMPIFVAIQNVLQGFLMCLGDTKSINFSTLIGVFSLLICAFFGIFFNFKGAHVAAYSMVISLGCEILLLTIQVPWRLYVRQYLLHQNQNIQEGT